jgi:hypothetical protein
MLAWVFVASTAGVALEAALRRERPDALATFAGVVVDGTASAGGVAAAASDEAPAPRAAASGDVVTSVAGVAGGVVSSVAFEGGLVAAGVALSAELLVSGAPPAEVVSGAPEAEATGSAVAAASVDDVLAGDVSAALAGAPLAAAWAGLPWRGVCPLRGGAGFRRDSDDAPGGAAGAVALSVPDGAGSSPDGGWNVTGGAALAARRAARSAGLLCGAGFSGVLNAARGVRERDPSRPACVGGLSSIRRSLAGGAPFHPL